MVTGLSFIKTVGLPMTLCNVFFLQLGHFFLFLYFFIESSSEKKCSQVSHLYSYVAIFLISLVLKSPDYH